jgi:7-carboxy-7-deazaguanine synthase
VTPSRLTIHETFYTFQGEGVHMGRAAFFIRTQGCDQDCWFCDAAGTWHKDWKPTDLRKATPEELAHQVEAEAPRGAMVVITGGEPCLYDLDPLIAALHRNRRFVSVETAGHRPLPHGIDWVTLSPKPFATHPLAGNVQRADEFKIIISDDASLDDALACIDGRRRDATVWLHPEWSHVHDPATLDLIVRTVKDAPRMFRAGYQLHKLYMADLLDPAARKEPVPLGGTGAAPW